MGGGNLRIGFCFYICKVKIALGLIPAGKCAFICKRTTKIRKANLKNVFLGWVCREARPLFLYPLSSPQFLRSI